MRKTVEWFAKEMDKELNRNSHKGGWKGCGVERLYSGFLEETLELYEQIFKYHSKQGIIEEAIDVANFAMMIADEARHMMCLNDDKMATDFFNNFDKERG